MYNPFSLQDKTILITGASSGIGKATAIECSKMGAKVTITGRNKEKLDDTFSKLEGKGHRSILADFSIPSDLETLVNTIEPIDGLVLSAGVIDHKPFSFVNDENLKSIFEINFFSAVSLCNLVLKKKKLNKNSSIVFISSLSGPFISYFTGSSYSATKGAINGMAKGMALDLAPKKIRVNTVCPGMIDTNILEEGKITEDQLIDDSKKYPLKRYGKPEEVAYSVIYLLSDASAWTTGSNLVLDGGYTLL